MSQTQQTAGGLAIYRRLALPSIPALEGVRALSVLLVILSHLGVAWSSGAHGVMAFFVLSGFLITWLLLRENELTGEVSLKKFYARRTLRIFPAFYVFWVIYIVLMWAVQHRAPWRDYMAAFFYVSNYYSAIVNPPHMAMSHTWSLGVEEQFYLLWPLVFRRYRNNLPLLTRILCTVIGVVWIYRWVLYSRFYPGYSWLFCSFDCRADHLAVGCLTAVVMKRQLFPRAAQWFTENSAAPLLTLSLLAGSMYLWLDRGEAYVFSVGFSLDPLLMAVLMVQWIALSGRPAWSWLNWSMVRYLGRISYSAYLYHWLVDNALITTRLSSLPLAARAVIAVIVSNLIAAASFRFVERPILQRKKRFEVVPSLDHHAGKPAPRPV
jgi:peptidoglycan/LPS O-acetylase OafA/YrhL